MIAEMSDAELFWSGNDLGGVLIALVVIAIAIKVGLRR